MSAHREILKQADQEITRAESAVAHARRQMAEKLAIACPRCGCAKSKVIARRPTIAIQLQVNGHWRQRRCEACRHIFETEEIVRTSESAA